MNDLQRSTQESDWFVNTEIQLHDSEIADIRQEACATSIVFSTAYVHESFGVPGRDHGRTWTQMVTVTVYQGSLGSAIPETPVWTVGGTIRLGAVTHDGFIPAKLEHEGIVELILQLSTADGSDAGELLLKGGGIRISLFGQPSEAEEFDEEPRR